ncbi:lysozyme inhibitor LprI family protein [Neoroseomonas alba]|nr:lysozyme inhibitor LprI family protein [Neoroseomonas alba]
MAGNSENDAAKELSTIFAECMERAGTQHIPRAACLTAERDRQDRRLNNVYRTLIGSLQGERRARMVEAQRLWVQLRQRDQAFEASILDALGPMGDLQSVENDARAIGQRADLLEKYLELSRL